MFLPMKCSFFIRFYFIIIQENMIKIDDLQLIGSGATANVYLYDNNKIIKLFNNDYDINTVNYEAKIAQEINDSCITAPKFYQTIIINRQNGIVYEFVEG